VLAEPDTLGGTSSLGGESTRRQMWCSTRLGSSELPGLLDHPFDHPDDPTGPVSIRPDRRGIQPEQRRSVWNRPDRRRAPAYGSGGWGFESLAARTKPQVSGLGLFHKPYDLMVELVGRDLHGGSGAAILSGPAVALEPASSHHAAALAGGWAACPAWFARPPPHGTPARRRLRLKGGR
jgi:hypothetical protein